MAFWGVEVKPGKPITHKCAQVRGRLRISQATLGSRDRPEVASRKSVVQCNVGFRSPVLLCVLLQGKTESAHLDLEFDEADNVIFSVIGSRSVYLTGYYVRQNHQSYVHSDSESYGVDIQNTPSNGYNFNSDDDKYGGSFINDEELLSSLGSPALSNDEGFDEVTPPRKARRGRGKLLKKKPGAIESDSDVNSPKKEDEDGFSLSQQEVLKVLKTHACDIGVKVALETVEIDDMANDDGVHGSETKQNADPLNISDKIERMTQSPLYEEGAEVNNVKSEHPKQVGSPKKIMVFSQEEICGRNTSEASINQNLPMINGEDQIQSLDLAKPQNNRKESPLTNKTSDTIERVTKSPLDEEGAEVNNAKNELPKQVGSSEKIMVSSQEEIHESNTGDALINQNLPMINGEDQMQSLDLAKPKNKRKERTLTDKISKVHTDDEDASVPRGHKELEIDFSADLAVGEDHMVSPELNLENGQKLKKRRNQLLEGEHTHVNDEKFQDITEENLSKQDSLHANGVTEHLPDHMVAPEFDLENSQKSKKIRYELLEGEPTQGTDEKIQDITEENLLKQDSPHADGMTEHLPVASGEYKQRKSEETTMENFGLECQNVQKEDEVIQEAANGENQKGQIDRNIGTITEFQASDNQLGKKIKKKRKKTQGNKDLIIMPIEELESGSQGGKVAVRGKMVKICYTGMLKDSGHVFDANAICKFRLGDEKFIDGWNIGIDGMRVGEKRRLIIPPSLGFGDGGAGKDIPPNSWLIYDIELVSVRRQK